PGREFFHAGRPVRLGTAGASPKSVMGDLSFMMKPASDKLICPMRSAATQGTAPAIASPSATAGSPDTACQCWTIPVASELNHGQSPPQGLGSTHHGALQLVGNRRRLGVSLDFCGPAPE